MLRGSVLPTLPCQLPTSGIADDVDISAIAKVFESKLESFTIDDLAPDIVWRDVFAYTGTLRTFYGASRVSHVWSELKAKYGCANVRLDPGSARIVRIGEQSSWIEARYSFENTVRSTAACKFIISLVPGETNGWKIWILRTILDQIEGYPNVDRLEPQNKQEHVNGDGNGLAHAGDHFDCVVIGGGQAGLSVGGRLQALKVSYVVLEKNESVGDNWKLRYDSARLHTTRDSSPLPFDRTFPSSTYGKFLTKDELARGYIDWAKKFGINIWTFTIVVAGEWVEQEKKWIIEIADANGLHRRSITASHIVMATGAGGQIAKAPRWPGASTFEGTIMHSGKYKSARAWKGKHAIVIGTANTGHDVAEDMVEAGCASVTMVQRSATYVFATHYFEKVQDMIYNERIPTDMADLSYHTTPIGVNRLVSNHTLHHRARMDQQWYDALENTGFKLIRYGDILHQLYERFGGHYMDVGSVAKITNGSIKIRSDAQPIKYGPRSLIFDDGSELEADVVVLATGFEGNTKSLVRDMFGSDVADSIEEFWGLDPEGEIQGAFKPSGHPALWMMGGSLGQARYFSRFVAFHIRTSIDGKPLEVLPRLESQ